jgi:hypothetical protein
MAAAEHPRVPRSGRPSDAEATTPREQREPKTRGTHRPPMPPFVVEQPGRLVVRIGSRPDQDEVDATLRELETATRQADLERRPVDSICCDAASAGDPDIGTVDTIARVALIARRLGRPISVAGASPELVGLIALAGLGRILRLAVELERQTEEREEPRGIEEERDPGDPAV